MKSMLLLFPAAICATLFLPSQTSTSLFEEYNALRAFKRAIYEDPLYILSDWNENDVNPCDWRGVTCSGDEGRVTALNLANSSLKGFITPELGELPFLKELILYNNLFLGIIPKEIGTLKSLTVLDLSTNKLTGSIPSEIGNLSSILKINFRSNGLTGRLPPEFGNLKSLVELRLDRNRFGGPIPGSGSSSSNGDTISSSQKITGLCLLEKLDIGDLSDNFFTGKIPTCLGYLPRSSFQGNCLNVNSPKQRKTKECDGYTRELSSGTSDPSMKTKSYSKQVQSRQPKWLLVLEIVTGLLLVFSVVTVAFVKKYKPKSPVAFPRKKTIISKDQTVISIDGEMLKHVLRLTRHELEVACEDFSNIIGSSSDSVVYKGTLKDGREIAVISLCISIDHWTNHLEIYFQSEVVNLARLTHENTAKLLGYCKENDPFTRMLVFEYASNGTLYEHLHYGEGCNLSWSRRMKIALGIARGLCYMHTEIQPSFSLSDLHSSAVYITEDFSPKLVDFESWKAVLAKAENSGYINGNPFQDTIERSTMDVQGNIFAFGVLLLEIVSGRPNFCKDRGYLVDWATQYLEKPNKMCHLVDPNLRYFNHDDLRVVCSVVSLCVRSEPSQRPSMQIVASMLENGIDTSASATLKESPLAWAEQALSS